MRTDTGFVDCDCARGGGYPTCSRFWALGRYATAEGRQHVEEATRAERERAAAHSAAADWVTRLQRMGVPATALVALRAPKDTPCVDAARKFLRSPRETFPLLAMIGKPGLGKTVAAAFVLADFARKWEWGTTATGELQPPAMFIPAARMTRLSSFDDADQTLFHHAARARLLVVDDLGDESTDFAKGHVVDLLKARIDANRRTVITSNLSPRALQERYGEALADRIAARSIRPLLGAESLRKRQVVP